MLHPAFGSRDAGAGAVLGSPGVLSDGFPYAELPVLPLRFPPPVAVLLVPDTERAADSLAVFAAVGTVKRQRKTTKANL